MIAAWPGNAEAQLQPAYEALRGADPAKGLIIDVRPNGGGAEPLAQKFAGCFIDAPKIYGRDEIRDSGQFKGPYNRIVEPSADGPKYRGKVAVLMGQACVSSNESFLLMMKQVPGCKLIGERSRGSSGNPKEHALPNDVIVYLPSWRDLRPDGTCFEGEGIAPDIEVKTQDKDFHSSDPVLDAALKYLRGR